MMLLVFDCRALTYSAINSSSAPLSKPKVKSELQQLCPFRKLQYSVVTSRSHKRDMRRGDLAEFYAIDGTLP